MQTTLAQLTVVIMAGLPGTGKTTLAYAVAEALGWPVLDKDIIHTALLDGAVEQGRAAPLAYDLLFVLAHDLVVQQHRSVILDTAGRHPMILERAMTIVRQAGARLKVIRCIAPKAVRVERLAMRSAKPSQWVVDQATEEDQDQWYRHLPPDALVVQASRPVEENVARALAFLQSAT